MGRQNALIEWNQQVSNSRNAHVTGCYNGRFMFDLLLALAAAGRVFFCSRADTALEVLALRQQVAMLKRKHPRPALNRLDRVLWMWLRQFWPRWTDAPIIVKLETVIGWHRAGFRHYWRWRSRPRCGRPKAAEEIRTVIRRMAGENAAWGAPKIHGELLKLGFVISERTVARYLRRLRRRGDPGTVAYLAGKSSRGDRCHRLLHRAATDVSTPVLLLRCRTRSSPDFALQCDIESNVRVGRAAASGRHSRTWVRIAT